MSLLCDKQILLDMLSNILEINDIYVGNSKINLQLVLIEFIPLCGIIKSIINSI